MLVNRYEWPASQNLALKKSRCGNSEWGHFSGLCWVWCSAVFSSVAWKKAPNLS